MAEKVMNDSLQKKMMELSDVVGMELREVGVVVKDVRMKTDDVIGMQYVDGARFKEQSKRIEKAKMGVDKYRTLCAGGKETLEIKIATTEVECEEATEEVKKMRVALRRMEKLLADAEKRKKALERTVRKLSEKC